MAESVEKFPWGLYYVIEEHKGKEVHVHKVVLDESTRKTSNEQLSSLNGFRRRMLHRHSDWISKHGYGVLMPRQFRIMFPDQLELEASLFEDLKALPIEERGDLWEFYKHIGYDHKRDKFVATETGT